MTGIELLAAATAADDQVWAERPIHLVQLGTKFEAKDLLIIDKESRAEH